MLYWGEPFHTQQFASHVLDQPAENNNGLLNYNTRQIPATKKCILITTGWFCTTPFPIHRAPLEGMGEGGAEGKIVVGGYPSKSTSLALPKSYMEREGYLDPRREISL